MSDGATMGHDAPLTDAELEAIVARAAPYNTIDMLAWPDEGHTADEMTLIQEDVPRLIAEVRRLRGTLDLYANPDVWRFLSDDAGDWWIWDGDVLDPRQLAKQALGVKPETLPY